MNGTVAPKLAQRAVDRGHEVVAWDRSAVDPNDAAASANFTAAVAPDAIAHLAFGAESWAAQLAAIARDRSLPFVYTSTTMVFAERPDGPYTIHSPRTATDDYGHYKIRCEDAIWAAHAGAMIVRLGYQIDADGRGNNMVAHLVEQQERDGVVRASTGWIPSCAFIDDTVAAMLNLIEEPRVGLHHLDSNADDAMSYFEIVTRLAKRLQRRWTIEPSAEPRHDQRLVDSRLVPRLSLRLP